MINFVYFIGSFLILELIVYVISRHILIVFMPSNTYLSEKFPKVLIKIFFMVGVISFVLIRIFFW